jgi:hypothetical protein
MKKNTNKRLRNLVLAIPATTLLGFACAAHSQVWSHSFIDMGVKYELTLQSVSGNVGRFDLTLDTTGYDRHANGYLDSVNIKAWDGADISFVLIEAPNGIGAWTDTQGSISGGQVGNTGCRGNGRGFACVQAGPKGVFDVASGGPYRFTFQVKAGSFPGNPFGAHVGAGYANSQGSGVGYGTTAVSLKRESEIFAMLLAGLGLMGFIARRRTSM